MKVKITQRKIIILLSIIGIIIYFWIVIGDFARSSNEMNVITNDTSLESDSNSIKFICPTFSSSDDINSKINKYYEESGNKSKLEVLRIPYENYDETLNLMLTSGEQADIFKLSYEWIPSYVKKNMLLDLKPYLNNKFVNQFPVEAINFAKGLSEKNKIYTIQAYFTTVRLIYNKELFIRAGINPEKPPRTLDEMQEYASKITQTTIGEGKYGYALPAGDEWSGFPLSMEVPATFSGINRYDSIKERYDLTIYKKWLQTLKNMKDKKSMFPGELALSFDNALAQFTQGNIGMIFAPSWVLPSIQKISNMDFLLGVAIPPILKGVNFKENAVAIPDYFSVNAKTNNKTKEEVVSLWKYLYSEDFQGALYSIGMLTPVIGNIKANPLVKPTSVEGKIFLKSDKENLIQIQELTIEDRTRFKTYEDILEGVISIDEGLRNETYRLNRLMDYLEIK